MKNLAFVLSMLLLFLAQPSFGQDEIGPNDFVALREEPMPLNLDELRQMIGFPRKALDAEIQGKVIVRVLIDEKGNYVRHVVLKNPHPILTDAVSSKISHLRCTPGIGGNNTPIKVWVTIPFDFRILDEDDAALSEFKEVSFTDLKSALAHPKPEEVNMLFLQGKDLDHFPMEILQFPNLGFLELGDNQLTEIPSSISQLKQLRYLGLSMNKLTAIPASLSTLPALDQLDLSKNNFSRKTQKEIEKLFEKGILIEDEKGKVKW